MLGRGLKHSLVRLRHGLNHRLVLLLILRLLRQGLLGGLCLSLRSWL